MNALPLDDVSDLNALPLDVVSYLCLYTGMPWLILHTAPASRLRPFWRLARDPKRMIAFICALGSIIPPDQQAEALQSWLSTAVFHGNAIVTSALLMCVVRPSYHLEHPLTMAARLGHGNVVDVILRHGLRQGRLVWIRDARFALDCAIENRRTRVIERLMLDVKPDPTQRTLISLLSSRSATNRWIGGKFVALLTAPRLHIYLQVVSAFTPFVLFAVFAWLGLI